MRLSDLVARYGGEEFVIAFPETELPQADALLYRAKETGRNRVCFAA